MQGIHADARASLKIQEGTFKVNMIGRLAEEANREIEALQRQVEGVAAAMKFEVRLDEYCSDLMDMHKARLDYHGASLSEAEQQSLGRIHDLTAFGIADYEAVFGPAPTFNNTITMVNGNVPLDFPTSLAPHHLRQSDDGVAS